MPRPSRIDEQRRRLLPRVCRAFSELGYRGATTAELARRCEVRENILYRLWRDKKAMFLAAIDDVFLRRAERWEEVLARRPASTDAVETMIAYEARHQGEFGFHRLVFTALVEADDAEIRAAISAMYRRFHERVRKLIAAGRPGESAGRLSAETAAWAMIGLATVSNVIRELNLLPSRRREKAFTEAARHLLSVRSS